MPGASLRQLFSAQQIQKRVLEIGAQIDLDYPDGSLHLVCILKGACFFMADLARAIERDVVIDFMGISTYGHGKTTSGSIRVTKDLDTTIEGADVLLIEDIVDTGHTLRTILGLLRFRGARSVKLCALLDKAAARQVEVPIDYKGFEIEPLFVVGYGLDFDERYRNLPYIAVMDPEDSAAAVPSPS